jgi:hypothetical protein
MYRTEGAAPAATAGESVHHLGEIAGPRRRRRAPGPDSGESRPARDARHHRHVIDIVQAKTHEHGNPRVEHLGVGHAAPLQKHLELAHAIQHDVET